MREIKFRAWDKVKGEMCDEVFALALGQSIGVHRDNPTLLWDNAELMQYTGLKDKNGKEIYEGDIVKGEFWVGEDIGLVKFGEHSIMTGHDNEYDSSIDAPAYGYFVDLSPHSECSLVDTQDLEVIGNIYENPGLLEGSR